METPRFEAVFNFGQVLQTISVVVAFAGMVWWQSDFQASTKARLETGEAIRVQYVPVVNGLAKAQEVTNSQLIAVGQTNRDLLKEIADLWREVARVRERLASLEASRPAPPR